MEEAVHLPRDPRKILPTVAYFSMEIGVDPNIHSYSGGLGILAMDTLRAAADNVIPMAGVTLLYRKGYFLQKIDAEGNQIEISDDWSPETLLEPLDLRLKIRIEERDVWIRVWRYRIHGITHGIVPVYFLDTALPENNPFDQKLTDRLYGGDLYYRLCQEAVLGLGGIAVLRALNITRIHPYHMNEGHSALLTLALLEEQMGDRSLTAVTKEDQNRVRTKCVFTTHTPVPAGHDQFPSDLVYQVLGKERTSALESCGCLTQGVLNMTNLALTFSHYVNGVAMRHGEISRGMYPKYPVGSITNGVHTFAWTASPFRELYDQYLPGWDHDNFFLRHVLTIPLKKIREAHERCKRELLKEVEKRSGVKLDPRVMTIGFARRMTSYKRPDMLFSDLNRLNSVAEQAGPFQLIFAGKAHPQDEPGKAIIRFIFQTSQNLKEKVRVVFVPNYDIALAQVMVSGVDLWLNTPQRPQEASGTSGMKAAMNGVPSFSVLDGWWLEGHLEGVTGWAIGEPWGHENQVEKEAEFLYSKLEYVILPMYYSRPDEYERVMRSAIAHNGSFFNTQRMMLQYLKNSYFNF